MCIQSASNAQRDGKPLRPLSSACMEQMVSNRSRKMKSPLLSIVQILLLACLGIILIPAGAHFFELPNKMALAPADYMITQRIYAGWAWFGLPIFLGMALLAIHAWLVQNTRSAMWLSLGCGRIDRRHANGLLVLYATDE